MFADKRYASEKLTKQLLASVEVQLITELSLRFYEAVIELEAVQEGEAAATRIKSVELTGVELTDHPSTFECATIK